MHNNNKNNIYPYRRKRNGNTSHVKLDIENQGRRKTYKIWIRFNIDSIHNCSWMDLWYSNLSRVRQDHCFGSIRGYILYLHTSVARYTHSSKINSEYLQNGYKGEQTL